MISRKQLSREWRRISNQLHLYAPRDAYLRFRDDGRAFSSFTRFQETLQDKVAVYLLYQPSGISPCTYETIQHLAQQGYSVIVVSNTKVTAGDRARLQRDAAALLIRKNFGYDIGGYKEALRWIWAWPCAPAELLLLNDSIYFPVFPDSDMLDRLSAAPSLFTGAMCHGAPPDVYAGSYLLHFKGAVLQDPRFTSFWKHYRMCSSKSMAIQQGEFGISTALREAGFAPGALYTPSALLATLRTAPIEETRKACRRLIARPRLPLGAALETLMGSDASSEAWQQQALAELERELAQRNDSLAVIALYPTYLSMPIIKKPPVHNASYRAAVIEGLAALRPRMTSGVAAEIFGTPSARAGAARWPHRWLRKHQV